MKSWDHTPGTRWPITRLGEHIHIKHGYAFKSEYFCSDGPYALLTPGNFFDGGGFKAQGEKQKRYNGPIPEGFILKPGDLVVAMTEQADGLLGSSAIIPRNGTYLHNQRIGLVTSDSMEPRFLYYLFNTRPVRAQISGSASGTKVRHTSPTRIGEVKFARPPRFVQQRIATILSAYDDLIEVNTRRIAVLEEMARRLFEEWFVKFCCAPKEVPTEATPVGDVPRGWYQPFADHVDFKEGPGLRNWQYRDSGVPFLNIRTLVSNDIDFSKIQYLDRTEVNAKYRHFLLAEYDHVVSSSGTIGRIVTIRSEHLPLMLNTSIIRMQPRGNRVGRWMLKHFLSSAYFQNQAKAFATGSAQMNFGPAHLKKMFIIAPDENTALRYEEVVTPLELQIGNLARQNRVLRSARNLLLPKLISGEIDLGQAEATLEAAQ